MNQLQRGAIGEGGDITIAANDNINFTGGSLILSDSRGTGNSGNITIEAGNSILLEGFFQENRGRFRRFPSQIVAQLRTEAEGEAGDIIINARELSLTDVAFISSNTSEGGVGTAGNILLNVDSLNLSENAFITASTSNNADGGAININAQTLNLTSGGKLITTTDSLGNAGNINLNISESITFDNSISSSVSSTIFPEERDILNQLQSEPSGIFADASELSTGNGGSVNIGIEQAPTTFTISNNARIDIDNEGTGNGGNLLIRSDSLTLDNNASISASTSSGEGGNITLDIDGNLSLQNSSFISAQAFETATGGNIDIDTDAIITIPNQNSNIIANSDQGVGGTITIDAEGIFGIAERPLNPITNDINASGGVDGEVIINTPDVDATQGIIELPTNVVEPEALSANACSGGSSIAAGNSFSIRGRSGVPPELTEPLISDSIRVEEPITLNTEKERKFVTVIEREKPLTMDEIVPARGMIIQENGNVILTAYPTPNTTQRTPNNKVNCS